MNNMERQNTWIEDKYNHPISEGDILVTMQGTRFIVQWKEMEGFILVQSNENNHPDLQGKQFELKKFMKPNLEVIGSIYKDADEMFKETKPSN